MHEYNEKTSKVEAKEENKNEELLEEPIEATAVDAEDAFTTPSEELEAMLSEELALDSTSLDDSSDSMDVITE